MTRLIPILAVAAILATGCGGSTAANTEASALAHAGDMNFINFTRCMRAHGVAMSDPFHRPGHSGLSIELPTQSPATKSAYGACQHFIQPVIAMKMAHAPHLAPASRLALVHYAECMRTRGIPMLDPDQFGNLNLGNVAGIANGPGRYTPQFHLADRLCRHLLPVSVAGRDSGTGP
jgi:hypothetical protein